MHFNKKKLSEICAATLIAGGLAVPTIAIAATAAGTLIKNLATVTYEDANGNPYSASSNEAVITVKQVYSAQISEDTDKNAAAGQSVYIQHTLTNTGNGEETYNVEALNDAITGDTIDSDSIKVYRDTNGNGLADAGEPEVTSTTPITLLAGESAELVIEVAVPSTATPGVDKIGVKLTATSVTDPTNIVEDGTGSGGLDGAEGTNSDLITVSNNAVISFNKSATLDDSDSSLHKITYILSATNTGNQPATDVKIFDMLPEGTTLVPGSLSGAGLIGTGDSAPAITTLDEPTSVMDFNQDGDTSDVGDGVSAVDASLAAGVSISVTFTVSYDPATFNSDTNPGSAGDIIKNTAVIAADTDGDPNTPDEITPTNPTQTTIPQSYGASISDTAGDADDEDDLDDETQTINTAPSGSAVDFVVTVTNSGTGDDSYELVTDPGNFPPGTTFTYWNEAGTVQLIDTNGIGGPDTGLIDPTSTEKFTVRAQLPSDVDATAFPGPYSATVTSTSAGDSTQSDTATLALGEIAAPSVDLYDNKANENSAEDEDDLGDAPYDINNGTTPGTRDVLEPAIGTSINVPLYIDNNAGSSDSFQLEAGSTWDGADTVGDLPAGWSVQFFKGDGNGAPMGTALSSTELLPGGTGGHEYIAVVTLPSDAAYALADYTGDTNGDGTIDAADDAFDGNGDGDGDQPLFIRIKSANSGSSDIMVDAIDVESAASVTLTPAGNNQLQPGGSVDSVHTLDNTGNTEETFELSSGDSAADDGWNNIIKVDTTGDGVPDTSLSDLDPSTDTIYGTDADGNPVQVVVTDADNDGNPEVTLPPGVNIDLTQTVFAPSNAAPGATDVTTITAENTSTDPAAVDATVDSVSTIIAGAVRLSKTVAYDPNCDGVADSAFAVNLPATGSSVAPGECVVWQIVAENQGDADARNVVIRDEVTAFTTFNAETALIGQNLKYGLGAGAALVGQSEAAGDDDAEHIDGAIAFFVGDADTDGVPGGTLIPGQTATVQFSTKVD